MGYSSGDFVHLISVVDTAGRPEAWLFDGVMLVIIRSPTGHNFATWLGPPYATGSDWSTYLDTLFAAEGPLARLDSAVALVSRAVGKPARPFAVSLVALYPEPRSGQLEFLGRSYNTVTTDGSAGAVAAYLQFAAARFRRAKLSQLQLDSFYWLHESIWGNEARVVAAVSSTVHGMGKRFLWVPFYVASGVEAWKTFGFDEAWLQPNYFFHPNLSVGRMDSAVTRATGLGMGLEIEFDGRLFTQAPDFGDRLKPYLDALERSPELRVRGVVVYEGSGALPRLSRARDRSHRELYCRLVTVLDDLNPRC
jgi:hypothetical protein